MPERPRPPAAASWLLSFLSVAHLPEILGDLTEEFDERVQSSGVLAARRWYYREVLRNMIALEWRVALTRKVRPKTLLLISGTWFGLALVGTCLWHHWLLGIGHQAWGFMTIAVLLVYFVLMLGWVVPFCHALVRVTAAHPNRPD